MSGQSSSSPGRLTTFVSFPSPYTQSLLVSALVSTIPNLALSLAPYPEDDPPSLQWADYDLLSFDKPHANPSRYLISSYIYRKALIRKHQLHMTIAEYLAKIRHRGQHSVLEEGGVPKGWIVDIQFTDELDELLVDDLYELAEQLRENEEVSEDAKRWYILKPGFADRAQGIRMFSTEDELRAIFDEFEPPSDDEDEEESAQDSSEEDSPNRLASRIDELGVEDDDEGGTGVMTSQLRHFVIQEYMPRPMLFDIADASSGHKFHLRAYVLITGAYTVHVAHTMLALFSGSPYVPPRSSEDLDLLPHLTNTCLQTDAYGAPTPPAELVKTFWELEGLEALKNVGENNEVVGKIDKAWLERTFAKVGEVVAESVRAGAECGSFGLQFLPNAFEIFGVDLLLSFPESTSTSVSSRVPEPIVTLLEWNASPDFHQSGDRLRKELREMFKGAIRIAVLPFFGIRSDDEDVEIPGEKEAHEVEWEVGDERWGWRMVGKGEIRNFGEN
ncbi:tubulin-tyrosine ligase family-domain-containing protein [Naematelia encephala]|uniref:Tubulin-tyrosine ligase family-domain-containing protein n=1 Tax=Naematelia encephala TaxID=71784 RepID=A0A1Y2BIK9_9TREE|nr:tubulin-tyrosine ligase family-domain-containing protein [Naematelia encephala]